MSETEIVITGVGVLCPLGIGREAIRASLLAGRSAVKRLAPLVEAGLPITIGAEVEGFDPRAFVANRKNLKVMSRDAQFGVAAALLACRDAALGGQVAPERLGVILGADRISNPPEGCEATYRSCLVEGRFDVRRWPVEGFAATFPLSFLMVLPNMIASHVSIALDARGPSNTIHHGDVSGLLAIGEAARVLQRGAADAMIAGGVGCQGTLFDWVRHCAMGRWSRRQDDPAGAMCPFDARRDGEVRGEGAGALVLETRRHAEARGARIVARLLGWSAAFDPPSRAGPGDAGLARAIRQGLAQARLDPRDVGHINAHGASTVEDDAREAQALADALPGVPVTAPKSFFGNLGAGAGTVEAVVSLVGLESGWTPPTLNYRCPDPLCPVDVVREPRALARRSAVLVNRTPQGQSAVVVLAGA
jgi:3-oxoacyl-[acyl-carrier-protein] synthase II